MPIAQRKRLLVIACALVLAGVAAHGRQIGMGYLALNDPNHFLENPNLNQGLTWRGWDYAWTDLGTLDNNWVPLARISHMLDFDLFGAQAWGHHLTNVLLHAANAALLFLALRALTGAVWRPAFVGLLLAVHPVHVESVAWVSERRDVLSLFFACLALWAYAGYARKPNLQSYPWVFLAGAAAILSKPTMVTLPCVMWLLDYWPLGRMSAAWTLPKARRWKALCLIIGEKLPLLAMAALSSWLTIVSQFGAFSKPPLWLRLISASRSYAAYLGLLVWPVEASPVYSNFLLWSAYGVLGCVLLLLVITYLAARTVRTRPYLAVGWFWFLGTMVPMIGLIQVGEQVYAARYAYFTFIGLYIAIVWGMSDLLALAAGRRRAAAAWGLAAAVAAAGIAGSYAQSGYWASNTALFRLAQSQSMPGMLTNTMYGIYAYDLYRDGRVREAEKFTRLAVDYDLSQVRLVAQLADLALKQGALDRAENTAKLAFRFGKPPARVLRILGDISMKRGQPAEALEQYGSGTVLEPHSALLQFNVGQAYEALDMPDEAIQRYARASEMNRGESRYCLALGLLLVKQKRFHEAILPLALTTDMPGGAVGDKQEAWLAMSKALAALGRSKDAATAAKQAEVVAATTRPSRP